MEEILNEEVINDVVNEDVAEAVVNEKQVDMLKAGLGIGLGIAAGMGLYKLVKFGVKKVQAKIAEKNELRVDENIVNIKDYDKESNEN